jgi:Protein of unknown function (DUF2934)
LQTVPRKPKTPPDNPAPESVATPSSNGKANPPAPKKKTRASTAPAKPRKTVAARKTTPKKPSAAVTKTAGEPTDDAIRLRAYFIAERRHRLSLPGDSNHDWIEARRQLLEEAGRSAPST